MNPVFARIRAFKNHVSIVIANFPDFENLPPSILGCGEVEDIISIRRQRHDCRATGFVENIGALAFIGEKSGECVIKGDIDGLRRVLSQSH